MSSRYIWDRYSLAGGDYYYTTADGTHKSGNDIFEVSPSDFAQGPTSISNSQNWRVRMGDPGARCLFDPKTGDFIITPVSTVAVGQMDLPVSVSAECLFYELGDDYGRSVVYHAEKGVRYEENSYAYGWILKSLGGRFGKLQSKKGPIKGSLLGKTSGPSQGPFLQVFFLYFSPLQHPLW